MIDLGLTSADRRKYEAALLASGRMRLRVSILDRNEVPIADLTSPSSTVLDGAVTLDADQAVTRSLSLTVVDPRRRLHLDPNSPSPSALFFDRFVRVIREDYVSALGRWVGCPVFWGPLNGFEEEDQVITITAQNKEALTQDPELLWQSFTRRKDSNAIATIKAVMQISGEARFDLPVGNQRLPSNLSLTRHDEAWTAAKKIATAINRQIFYDGLGRVRVREWPSRQQFAFYATEKGGAPAPGVLTKPKISYDFTVARNIIEVLGYQPAGRKPRVRAVARAPKSHALSPENLGRNGKERFLVEVIENDQLKRNADAKAVADRTLADKLRVGLSVQFDALAAPHLEPGDMVALVTDGQTIIFRLAQFSIPLTSGGAMSVGRLQPQTIAPRRKR